MTAPIREIRGVRYRRFRTVFPGERLFFVTGNQIAIEHWAYEVGQHHFDYEVNSRPVLNGRPQAIATTRDALQREFLERKVNTRQVIPVSIGDSDGNRIPEVAMTYGEVAPQIYRSRVEGPEVAWSIIFGLHRHVSTQGAGGTALSIARPNANVVQNAARSANAQQMQSGHNYLMLWIPVDRFGATRLLPNGFGTTDVIGYDPPLHRRIIQWITGR